MAHYRNFDALRLAAASTVLFSHAFLIAEGTEAGEPVYQATGRILGIYGVYLFFVLSGFLVTGSLLSSASVAGFLRRRFLRIYPGYIVSVLVVVLVAAALYGEAPLGEFLAGNVRTIVASLTFYSDGPYFEDLAIYSGAGYLGHVLNGSLWSIRQELVCYLLLALLFHLRMLNLPIALAVVAVGFAGYATDFHGLNRMIGGTFFVLPAFFCGVAMHFVAAVHRPTQGVALLCVLAIAAAVPAHALAYVFPPAAAYLVAYLGMSVPWDLRGAARFGDLSYGIYLYGWPIEQAIRAWQGEGVAWWVVFGLSLPLATACALVSWHLVEKRALRLKDRRPTWPLVRLQPAEAEARVAGFRGGPREGPPPAAAGRGDGAMPALEIVPAPSPVPSRHATAFGSR